MRMPVIRERSNLLRANDIEIPTEPKARDA